MKKSFLCFAIIITGVSVQAQTDSNVNDKSADVYNSEFAPPPPPPTPPEPPRILPVQFSGVQQPPAPPAPPAPTKIKRQPPVVINSTGYDLSVHRLKGQEVIMIRKGSESKRINMKTWNANRKFYETKYGKLPPPPPLYKRII